MIFDALELLIRYGLSWTAIAVLFVRNRRLRKYINKHLPKVLQEKSDSDLAEIKRDVKAIKSHLGVSDCGGVEELSNRDQTNSSKFLTSLQMGGLKRMKEYLRKLGSRKFQAYLVATVTNIAMLIGYIMNVGDVQEWVSEWMPAINVTSQTVATWLYIWVEGSVDKAKGDSREAYDTSGMGE